MSPQVSPPPKISLEKEKSAQPAYCTTPTPQSRLNHTFTKNSRKRSVPLYVVAFLVPSKLRTFSCRGPHLWYGTLSVSTRITVLFFNRVLFTHPSQTGTAAFATSLDLSWSFNLPLIRSRGMRALYLAHGCCLRWIKVTELSKSLSIYAANSLVSGTASALASANS